MTKKKNNLVMIGDKFYEMHSEEYGELAREFNQLMIKYTDLQNALGAERIDNLIKKWGEKK